MDLASEEALLAAIDPYSMRSEQIAEVLGVPQGTVWSRLHNARKKLAAYLEHSIAERESVTR